MLRRSPDFWSGLALAALGGYIVNEARRWDYLTADGPGPGFFPLWYGIAILALSLALVLASTTGPQVDWKGTGRALATWAALAASLVLMKLIGFALAFAMLAYFVVAVMYRRGAVLAAVVAAALAAGFYLVFPLALGITLP